MTVRLLTWNIRTGGGKRLPAIEAVLRREQPDLVCLQELRGFDQGRIDRLARELGLQGHLARSVFGQPVAVLARGISRRRSVTSRLHHAAAAVTTGDLTLVSTHLNPFSPERRRREATWLAARFHAASRLVLLAGDLNGLHPGEEHTLAGLDPRYHRRHLAADGTVDTRGLAAFERGGLSDLWPGTGDGHTVPTTQGGGAEFGAMRLDYVLGNPAAAGLVREMRVLRGGETEYASDHYPLLAELDL
ncbi:endonuclease/exonuclease/phosphatase family protein [Actinoplanes sp. NPDC026619]|uniref:endonuclease/exonuclease/phosphatase family protein n=1 Tax=Actinoplanes sp. NPDC026619 TaxID=3155798 RepID=UPI00340CF0CE